LPSFSSAAGAMSNSVCRSLSTTVLMLSSHRLLVMCSPHLLTPSVGDQIQSCTQARVALLLNYNPRPFLPQILNYLVIYGFLSYINVCH
jgi:hypothetical protein